MKLFTKKQNSKNLSLPTSKTVHGIKIEKVKVGRYLETIDMLQDLPKTVLEKCFPDEGVSKIISRAKTADAEFVSDFISKLLINAPEILIDMASVYLDVEKAVLLDLTPNELLEVLSAWWELNDLSAFFRSVWSKVKPLLQTKERTGFKDGLQ